MLLGNVLNPSNNLWWLNIPSIFAFIATGAAGAAGAACLGVIAAGAPIPAALNISGDMEALIILPKLFWMQVMFV